MTRKRIHHEQSPATEPDKRPVSLAARFGPWLNRANLLGMFWIILTSVSHGYLFPYWLRYGGFILFFATWCIEFLLERRWQVRPERRMLFFAGLLVYFLLAFAYPHDYHGEYFARFVEFRYRLLGFGIVGLFGLNKLYNQRVITDMFAVAAAVVMLFVLYANGTTGLFRHPDLFVETRTYYVNIHTTFDLFMLASLLLIWWTAFHSGYRIGWLRAVIYASAVVLILLNLVLTDGRLGVGMGIGLTGFIIVYEIWLRRRLMAVLVAVVCIASGIFALSRHSRMNVTKEEDGRLNFWHSAAELIEEKPVFGYGISRAQEEFDRVSMKYQTDNFIYWWTVAQANPRTIIHPHSQYVQTMLEFGAVGLLLLLFIYLSPIVLAPAQIRMPIVLLSGLFMAQSLFEPVLTWHLNTLYCVLMTTMLLLHDDKAAGLPAKELE